MAARTFLQLVQETHREAGVGGSPPSAVTSQVGRAADIVRWVNKAHEKIQLLHPDWTFDWARSNCNLSSGDDLYDPVVDFGITLGIRNFVREGAYVYDTTVGVSSRQWMQYLEWERFRSICIPVVNGIPTAFTLRPDGNVQYFPRPDRANLVAVHEYYLQPQTLTASSDTPRIPSEYQDVIVWQAVMLYCDRIKDQARYNSAIGEYDELIDKMEQRCRPGITIGGPLA